jgi:ABC-2 type transport system ATP-binding protein
MISVQALSKVYGPQKAIDSISFQIGKGEIVGFLGPNGAGKTTTMKIITCFMPPSSGTVEVDGLNIHDHALEIRKKIGYLPEHNPLYLDMYVHEFLHFSGRLYGLAPSFLKGRVPEVVEMTGLGREQHKKIGLLSKGYRQRVGLSQALLHDPDILILDEPTTGLDPNQIVEIRSLIREIGKEKTVIFSTHILPEVEAIANRVVIINRGKIVADESLEMLRAESGQQNILKIEFERAGFNPTPILDLHGGTTVMQDGENQRLFTFTLPDGVDLRPSLYHESQSQNNPISMLLKKEKNLEEIFRGLTN